MAAAKLPYLVTPGTITTALDRIKKAATPPTVNSDFVHTKLRIKGGAGRAIAPYLKKVGLVNSDGSPTQIYERFRNSTESISGAAIAEAVRLGYKPLFEVNEYAHDLSDKDLRARPLALGSGGASSLLLGGQGHLLESLEVGHQVEHVGIGQPDQQPRGHHGDGGHVL